MSLTPLKTAVFLVVLFLAGLATPARASVREIASIVTSAGTMEFELYQDTSPRAVANFKYLAETKFYDGTAFHRLIRNFMIQGGCPITREDTNRLFQKYYGGGGPGYSIPDEPSNRADRKHVRGVLSMGLNATNDDPPITIPNSAGSQFFIMFGDAPWLDGLHTTVGFLISGNQTLADLESQISVGTSTSIPPTRLPIHAVRIRSEITVETPKYQSGTVGGLLRAWYLNHYSWSEVGKYTLTLNSIGSFSGKFQYHGRQCAFVGKLPPITAAHPEQEVAVISDPKSLAPLRVRVRVRQSTSLKNSVSISVCEIARDGADVLGTTYANATSELAAPSVLSNLFSPTTQTTGSTISTATLSALLSNRYTVGFSQAGAGGYLTLPELQGKGFLTLGITPSTGLCTVSGQLADNRAISFSQPISSEGGRMSISIYSHDTPFTAVSLSQLSLGSLAAKPYVFHLAGVLELPKTDSLVQDGRMYTTSPSSGFVPYSEIASYLFWQQGSRPTGVIRNQISGAYLLPTTAGWKSPKTGTVLHPFNTVSAGTYSQISIGTLSSGSFQITKSNTATTFQNPSQGTILRLNPANGTFSGSFLDTTSSLKTRRTFQGVLIQEVGAWKGTGVGFSLTNSASLPVSITP